MGGVQRRSAPVMQWLAATAKSTTETINIGESVFSGRHAVETGWWRMRSAMRSWGTQSEPDFADSIQRQGFPGPRAGQHFCAEAQRHDLQQAIIYDARVALWEQACVAVSLGL